MKRAWTDLPLDRRGFLKRSGIPFGHFAAIGDGLCETQQPRSAGLVAACAGADVASLTGRRDLQRSHEKAANGDIRSAVVPRYGSSGVREAESSSMQPIVEDEVHRVAPRRPESSSATAVAYAGHCLESSRSNSGADDGPVIGVAKEVRREIYRAAIPGIVHNMQEITQHFRDHLETFGFRCRVRCKERKTLITGDGQCTESAVCPVIYGCHYGLGPSRCVPPQVIVIWQTGNHDHTGASVSGKIWKPQQLRDAEAYLEVSGAAWSAFALENFLLARHHTLESLPPRHVRRQWLKRQKAARIGPVRREASIEATERSLVQWAHEHAQNTSLEQLRLLPGRRLSENEGYVLFSCEGMLRTAERCAGAVVNVGVGAKMKVLLNGWSVLSFCLLMKDGMRKTTLGRQGQAQIQGLAASTTVVPFLQAFVSSEFMATQLFRDACELWNARTGSSGHLERCVRQMHKDQHPALEAARQNVFPRSRACNDYAHAYRNVGKQVSKHCVKTTRVLGSSKQIKTYEATIVRIFNAFRVVPTADLASSLWQAFLRRLRAWNEDAAADYFSRVHLSHEKAGDLRRVFNIPALAAPEEPLTLAHTWYGVCGSFPGAGNGSQAVEAFHSPWGRELSKLGGAAAMPEALRRMQQVINHWMERPLLKQNTPVTCACGERPACLLDGQRLRALNRWPAAEYFKHRNRTNHMVLDACAFVCAMAGEGA